MTLVQDVVRTVTDAGIKTDRTARDVVNRISVMESLYRMTANWLAAMDKASKTKHLYATPYLSAVLSITISGTSWRTAPAHGHFFSISTCRHDAMTQKATAVVKKARRRPASHQARAPVINFSTSDNHTEIQQETLNQRNSSSNLHRAQESTTCPR